MEEDATPESNSVGILYEVAIKVLGKQIDNLDSLDSKVRGIFAFITVIFGALAAFLSPQTQKLSTISVIVFWTALFLFILIVVLCFLAYRVKELSYLTRGQPLVEIANLRLGATLIKTILLQRIANQHEYNEGLILKKANYVRAIIWLTFIDLLIILGLLVTQVFQNRPILVGPM